MNDFNPLWLLPAFPLFFAALWGFVSLVLSIVGGWRSLAEAYPSTGEPDGERFRARSAHIGFVNYNGCLNLTAGSMHLHMVPLVIFRLGHAPLSVPWTDITATMRRGFIFTNIELRLARVSRVRILMPVKTVSALAQASSGQLVIDSGEG